MPTNTNVHRITPPQFIRQHILQMEVGEVSEAIGVAASIWSRYELHGRIPEHHYDKLKQLAKDKGTRILNAWFDRVPFETGVPV